MERVANLRGVFQRLFHTHRPLERRALDVLHYQIVRTNVVKLADVGMVECRYRARFALEALRKLFFYNFDCNSAIQSRVASTIDFAHASGANGFEEFISAQPSSGSQGHRRSNDCTVRELAAPLQPILRNENGVGRTPRSARVPQDPLFGRISSGRRGRRPRNRGSAPLRGQVFSMVRTRHGSNWPTISVRCALAPSRCSPSSPPG
jgi:hypothetical protein